VGYGYKAVLTEYFGWGLSATVWSAISFGLAYSLIYIYGLHGLEQSMQQQKSEVCASESITFVSEYGISDNYPIQNRSHGHTLEMTNTNITHQDTTQQLRKDVSISLHNITAFERFKLVMSLWPYTIPLFTVYAAEYIIQAGVWSSIGFPVTSATSRAQFYQYSNWAVSDWVGNSHSNTMCFMI
jgi:battenin